LLFEKGLTKAVYRDKEFSSSDIINLINSGGAKVGGLANEAVNIIKIPFEVVLGLIFLAVFTGWAIVPTTVLAVITMVIIKKCARISLIY
jgi:hypothetical protein